MPTISLSAGKVNYQESGPSDGRPLAFVHGYAMGSSLWRPLAERLSARGFRCIAPTWPLGAHTEPMRKDTELTMESIAAMIGELAEALGLDDVVLVGNDTGGAVCQIVAPRARGGWGRVRRLASALPNARLEVIQGERTFSMIDQPVRLAEVIAEFAADDDSRRVESHAAEESGRH